MAKCDMLKQFNAEITDILLDKYITDMEKRHMDRSSGIYQPWSQKYHYVFLCLVLQGQNNLVGKTVLSVRKYTFRRENIGGTGSGDVHIPLFLFI